mgnify:CR=1 FL=1
MYYIEKLFPKWNCESLANICYYSFKNVEESKAGEDCRVCDKRSLCRMYFAGVRSWKEHSDWRCYYRTGLAVEAEDGNYLGDEESAKKLVALEGAR